MQISPGMIFLDKQGFDTYIILYRDEKCIVYLTTPEGVEVWANPPERWNYVEQWLVAHKRL